MNSVQHFIVTFLWQTTGDSKCHKLMSDECWSLWINYQIVATFFEVEHFGSHLNFKLFVMKAYLSLKTLLSLFHGFTCAGQVSITYLLSWHNLIFTLLQFSVHKCMYLCICWHKLTHKSSQSLWNNVNLPTHVLLHCQISLYKVCCVTNLDTILCKGGSLITKAHF